MFKFAPIHTFFQLTPAKKLIFWIMFFWVVIIAVCGWTRPIFPSNELRYISVAWEMWVHHSIILPLQGGNRCRMHINRHYYFG